MENIFNETYAFYGQNASDDPYYAAGTHHPSAATIPSAQQLEHDVDAGLLGFSFSLDTPDVQDGQETDDWLVEYLSRPAVASNLPANPALGARDPCLPQLPRRTNSDLRAEAPPFVPSGQLWPGDCAAPAASVAAAHNSNYNNDVAPGLQQRVTHQPPLRQLTPLQTNFCSAFQPTPPDSTKTPHEDWQQSLSAGPETSSPRGILGYQWNLDTPPAQAMAAWAKQTSFAPGGRLIGQADAIDPAMLTPTPTTPTAGGSALERTTSRTATSAASYLCEHDGCGKEFKSKTDYSHHRRNHGLRPHECSSCPKSFVFRKDLNRHEKTHNPSVREFYCQIAGCPWAARGFQRRDHYVRHMRAHHRAAAPTPSDSSAAMSRSAS